MAVDHVEVALVDRQVDRLADGPAAVVQVGRQVGQLHEVAEVLDGPVAAPAVQVAHERRAVGRREDRAHAADVDVARRVAGDLPEVVRGGGLDDGPAHAAREADPLAVDVGAGLAQQAQGVRVAAEVDADLLEDRVGVVLDEREPLLREDLEGGHRARQERRVDRRVVGSCGLSGRSAAGASAARLVGHRSSSVAIVTASPPRGLVVRSSSVARLRRRRPERPFVAAGSGATGIGRSTTRARFGVGAVLWGMAMAATKCSWKRGSTAVSIFSTRRTWVSISRRASADRRAMRAPVPAALPTASTRASSQSGMRPRTMAWKGSIWLPKAPARRTCSIALDAQVVHEQPRAGVEGGLGELDGAHVVLRDEDARRALVEHVAEGAAVGDDARRPGGQAAVDDAVGRDDAGQVELGDDLDDARPADAGHAALRRRLREAGLVRPEVRADDPEARLERLAVDAHPLDGAGRGPLAGADLGALEGRTGRAGCRQQPAGVAEHDLGVRADVHDERHLLRAVGRLGQHHAGGVGAHVAGDAGQHVQPRAGVDRLQPDVAGAGVDGTVGGQGEGRRAERHRVDAQQQVMHDRVAHHAQLEDVVGILACLVGQARHEVGQGGAHDGGHLGGAARRGASRTRRGS